MKKALAWVTGANGFIGSNLLRRLSDCGWSCVAICRNGGGPPGVPVAATQLAAAELNSVSSRFGFPDVIFHIAGGASVGSSVAYPDRDFVNTVTTTQAVADWIRTRSPQTKMVFSSSAAVYGQTELEFIPEGTPPAPCSPYGFHKLMAEHEISMMASVYGLRTVIVRLFSVYGPGLKKQLLWDISSRLRRGEQELLLGGTGAERRDFLFVDDATDILVRAATATETSANVINAGTGIATSVREVAEKILNEWSSTAKVRFSGEIRAGDPASIVADTKLMRESLGKSQFVPLSEGIAQTVRWHRHAANV